MNRSGNSRDTLGDLLGVDPAGDGGDGDVDVLDGEGREGGRAVEVAERLVQVHYAAFRRLQGLAIASGGGGGGRFGEAVLGEVLVDALGRPSSR
jgi:hypothetical protein